MFLICSESPWYMERGAARLHPCSSLLHCLPSVSRGVGPGCNTREIAHKLIELKAEIEDLEQRERELEQQKMWVQQSIRNVSDDVQNNRYPFPLMRCVFSYMILLSAAFARTGTEKTLGPSL